MFLTLRQMLFGKPKDSKATAKSRLSFVLVQDRTGLSSDEMMNFKREMMEVVEHYFVIDKTGFDVQYQREQESTVLLINSPVIARRKGAVVGSPEKAGKAKKGTQAAAAAT